MSASYTSQEWGKVERMSEVVWVACISAGAALVTALVTQFLATRAASKSADRAERKEALQWQRNEAIRHEELERKRTQDALENRDAQLRELWSHVLDARWQVLNGLEALPIRGRPATAKVLASSAEFLPEHAAGKAYSVALLGLAALRPSARAFYQATSRVQLALLSNSPADDMTEAAQAWSVAYKSLEDSVAAFADGVGVNEVPFIGEFQNDLPQ